LNKRKKEREKTDYRNADGGGGTAAADRPSVCVCVRREMKERRGREKRNSIFPEGSYRLDAVLLQTSSSQKNHTQETEKEAQTATAHNI